MENVIPNIDKLLKQITLNNDEEAYRHLFEYAYPALYLYARRYIDNQADREDIIQDVFCKLWTSRNKINCNISAKNFLITCVKNQCLNYLRKQGTIEDYMQYVSKRTPIYDTGGDNIYMLHELENKLNEALSKLPPEYRTAFEMSRIEGKSKEEIAEILNVSPRTIERYRQKATDHLKKELREYLPLLVFLFP
ncbi:RNA polymerase sigma-70 factor [Parabacteroides sp. APC149_11_2_Y6]